MADGVDIATEIAEQITLRDFAIVDRPFPMYVHGETVGPMVVHFTPAKLAVLRSVENMFACKPDANCDPYEHARQFAWICSTSGRIGDKSGLKVWLRENAHHKPKDLIEGIIEYLGREFSEAAKGDDSERKESRQIDPLFEMLETLERESIYVDLIHTFGSKYGWTPETTLNQPFLILHALQRAIYNEHAQREKQPTISKADRYNAKIVKEINASKPQRKKRGK